MNLLKDTSPVRNLFGKWARTNFLINRMDNLLKKILKPNSKLEVRIIDPNDPKIKEAIRKCQEAQQKILDSQLWTQEKYERLKTRITI